LARPISFAAEWNESKHARLLARVAERVLGRPTTVVFRVQEDRQRRPQMDFFVAPRESTATATATNVGTTPLNERYSFQTFVIGKSNELAAAAAHAVAEAPGKTYNPLFIYGATGHVEFHGPVGRPFPEALSRRNDAAGRRLSHQRPLDEHRPPVRLHRGDASLQGDRLVALFASTAHVVDIGGIGFGADARQVYEEGLCIPIMPLAQQGKLNEHLFAIVEANVREPIQVKATSIRWPPATRPAAAAWSR